MRLQMPRALSMSDMRVASHPGVSGFSNSSHAPPQLSSRLSIEGSLLLGKHLLSYRMWADLMELSPGPRNALLLP
ncbi:uncharacterized protein Dana_GF26563, isoform B [Drosophila ananassae]|uniref:Uncharacterized protein, isoform B n=1 Tax=Drosophila ananassae TaxID=7217 RepID=A0A0P9C784_DROAN|nr:uncharacterized protein Dana_GF26563, isoform B [Drosophila ananassae]